jgi:hypothetical protein
MYWVSDIRFQVRRTDVELKQEQVGQPIIIFTVQRVIEFRIRSELLDGKVVSASKIIFFRI